MQEINTQTLSVSQWYTMAQEGISVPVTIRLAGYSMQPLLRKDRDPVTVMPVYRPPKIGDIVMFLRADGVYVMHRVSALENEMVITIGDNCIHPDHPMHRSMVLGLAVRAQRGPLKLNLDCPGSRIYGRIWMTTRPVRVLLYYARRVASKLKHKLCR